MRLMLVVAAVGAVASSGFGVCPDGPAASDAPPAAEPVSTGPARAPAGDWLVARVGGDLGAQIERDAGGGYRFESCRIATPLAEGYPKPTPPGAIDLKRYPVVRRAALSGNGPAGRGMDNAFWPLFKHIKARDIAMTAPVEMEFHESQGVEQWTMSFLYREVSQGPTGEAERGVRVEDAPPMTVIALGFRGNYKPEETQKRLEPVMEWLEAHPEWEQVGDPRALYYNGPEQWFWRRWGEVQIPIRERATPPAPTSAPFPAAETGSARIAQ